MRRFASSSLWRDRRGVTAIEFGIIGSTLFLMLLGGMEVARDFATRQQLHSLMVEALRTWQAAIGAANVANSTLTTCTAWSAPTSSFYNSAPLIDSTQLTWSTHTCSFSNTTGLYTLNVALSYNYTYFGPLSHIGSSASTTLTEASQISF